MDAFYIIIDSHWMASRLPRCLAMLENAIKRYHGLVEVHVVAVSESASLTSLSRRFGAHLTLIPQPSIGARGNEMARRGHGRKLIFIPPRVKLASDWLLTVDRLLDESQWDALLLRPRRPITTRGIKRLWPMAAGPSNLCVHFDWFERIGGFDPALDDTAYQDLANRLRACQARVLELEL